MSFLCGFCGETFSSADELDNHTCHVTKTVERILRHDDGKAIYALYCKYCHTYNKQTLPIRGFSLSKWAPHITRFFYIAKQYAFDTTAFIQVMYSKRIEPRHWCKDYMVQFFYEHVLYRMPVAQCCSLTIRTLDALAHEHNCDVSNVLDVVDLDKIIELIQQNKISPWILLNSFKFKQMFERDADYDQINMVKSFINPAFWKFKFVNDKDSLHYAQECVKQLKL